jgi:hypothetical protein
VTKRRLLVCAGALTLFVAILITSRQRRPSASGAPPPFDAIQEPGRRAEPPLPETLQGPVRVVEFVPTNPVSEPNKTDFIGRQTTLPTSDPAAARSGAAPPQKRELKDPVARMALNFVGLDEDAEAYWYAAINDPALSAHERSDLIEDLNEDGFPDPKNITADDLPLIMSRMLLIEELAPESMDEVNAAAFREAYKDLVNMYAQAAR